MSLSKELIEYTDEDQKIVSTFACKDTLSTKIFEKNGESYILKSDVRTNLLEITEDFISFVGVEFFVYDVILTGSLSNYNWSTYSDVDLHILIDMSDFTDNLSGIEEIVKELFDSKKNLWNEQHNIKVMDFDVEIYIQDLKEEHVSSGVYSILNNEWLVVPDKIDPRIDDKKILQRSDFFSKKVDKIINSNEKDKSKIIKKIEGLRKELKDFRQSGLESGGEYSYENLTFKLLRRNGTIERLLDYKTKVFDENLSIGQ